MGFLDIFYQGPTVEVSRVNKLIEKRDIKGLIKVLKRKYPESFSERNSVRAKIAEVLGILKDPRATKPLIEALHDKSSSVRAAAAEALGNIGDKSSVPYLIQALRKESGIVWADEGIIRGLGKIRDVSGVEPIIQLLQDKKYNKTTHNTFPAGAVAEALARIGEPAITPLVQLLKHEDKYVRRRTVEVLSHLKIVDPNIEALNDSEASIRLKAVSNLASIGDNRSTEALIQVIKNGKSSRNKLENSVLENAIRALGAIKDSRAVEPLIEVLNNRNSGFEYHTLRLEAIDALGRIGDKRAIEHLKQALIEYSVDKRLSGWGPELPGQYKIKIQKALAKIQQK